jgi:hypothetical protein
MVVVKIQIRKKRSSKKFAYRNMLNKEVSACTLLGKNEVKWGCRAERGNIGIKGTQQ